MELLFGIILFFFGEKRDIEREVDDGESMLFVMAAVKKKNKTWQDEDDDDDIQEWYNENHFFMKSSLHHQNHNQHIIEYEVETKSVKRRTPWDERNI